MYRKICLYPVFVLRVVKKFYYLFKAKFIAFGCLAKRREIRGGYKSRGIAVYRKVKPIMPQRFGKNIGFKNGKRGDEIKITFRQLQNAVFENEFRSAFRYVVKPVIRVWRSDFFPDVAYFAVIRVCDFKIYIVVNSRCIHNCIIQRNDYNIKYYSVKTTQNALFW